MGDWGMWPKRPSECECKGNYEGECLRCQMCGTPHRWGEERVSYKPNVVHRGEAVWEAWEGNAPWSDYCGVGPTKAAALSDLKRKVRERASRRARMLSLLMTPLRSHSPST